MIIGEPFSLPGVIAWSCVCAWTGTPKVNPPANVAPPLRSSLRLVRFEPIGPSFEFDPIGLSFAKNDTTTKSRPRGREYTRPCQIWPVPMGTGLRIVQRQPSFGVQLTRVESAAWCHT